MRKTTVACALIIAFTHGHGNKKASPIQEVVQCNQGWCFDDETESCLPMNECDIKLSKKEQLRK